ncbi:citrate lyase holo-[acyl-carrier protein] synthase [Carnobacterium maltaromaticum]|uniref:citrate lyase holo-[acyl-carrier protein] synthase n=1 Tax=Carnobacterium maltaromaticum TaxID=2751 RepID=UPI00191B9953|nr:citrate lyase holo-[acyl-carrier protein] synthase [Carnobacterium maltaromaticum]CAD5896428.1 Holo-ACP synthase [Carnobacterium maltaromaticum]
MDLFAGGKLSSLQEILDRKERRAFFQLKQLHSYQKPVLSFQCNIPGPIKNSPVIERVFQMGVEKIRNELAEYSIFDEWEVSFDTGPEYFAVVDCLAIDLKEICIQIEETGIGRLYDIDILVLDDGNANAISRIDLGYVGRKCLICNKLAKVCGRSQSHPLAELHQSIEQLVEDTI